MPFVVENGSFPTQYRTYVDFGFGWTESLDDAIHYARRKDAELVHAEDIDACFFREVDEHGLIPQGPYRAELIDRGWYITRYDSSVCRGLIDVASMRFSDTDAELFCRVCVVALNRSEHMFAEMRARHDAWLAKLLAGETVVTVSHPDNIAVAIHSVEEIANNIPPLKLLYLLREFCIANATQWQVGAGTHHPLWGMIAQALSGLVPITEGPEWAFIQPHNRESLEDLHNRVTHGHQKDQTD